MNNLPQSIINQINAEADKYGFVVPYNGSKSFYIEDKVKGYLAGATEWADNAKPVVDFLEEISESNCDYESTGYVKSIHSPECRACKAKEVLAKYKEVTNG
jgi:hypothetical protein